MLAPSMPKYSLMVNKDYQYILLLLLTLGNHDPEGGLKIRKIYKKLRISSNPCSHDLANCHATEQHQSAVPRLSISETFNWSRGFSRNVRQPSAEVWQELASLSAWYCQFLEGNGSKHVSTIQNSVFTYLREAASSAAAPAPRAPAEM